MENTRASARPGAEFLAWVGANGHNGAPDLWERYLSATGSEPGCDDLADGTQSTVDLSDGDPPYHGPARIPVEPRKHGKPASCLVQSPRPGAFFRQPDGWLLHVLACLEDDCTLDRCVPRGPYRPGLYRMSRHVRAKRWRRPSPTGFSAGSTRRQAWCGSSPGRRRVRAC